MKILKTFINYIFVFTQLLKNKLQLSILIELNLNNYFSYQTRKSLTNKSNEERIDYFS